MNPDEKYMFQVNLNDKDFKFVPPLFINKNLRDDVTPNDNNNLDLFLSETGLPKLCYYCNDSDDSSSRNTNMNETNYTIPTSFDVLRSIDLDLDETQDLERVYSDNDVNKIYSRIERNHPGIFATLYSYRIPRPIVRVIVKRLIKISLSYCDNNNDY